MKFLTRTLRKAMAPVLGEFAGNMERQRQNDYSSIMATLDQQQGEKARQAIGELRSEIAYLRSEVAYLRTMNHHSFFHQLFNTFDDIDPDKEIFLVSVYGWRLIKQMAPLLDYAAEQGIQVVILYSPSSDGDNFDREFFRIFASRHKVILMERWRLPTESMASRKDFIAVFYHLICRFRVRAVITMELCDMPFHGFVTGFPFKREYWPPIVSLKLGDNCLEYFYHPPTYFEMAEMMQYCSLQFVMGDIQRRCVEESLREYYLSGNIPDGETIFANEVKKLVRGGYCHLDTLRDVPTTRDEKTVFFIGSGPPYHEQHTAAIKALLNDGYTVILKRHVQVFTGYEELRGIGGRFIQLGDFDEYLPALAACDFAISSGSTIGIEALVLKKPHVVLASHKEHDLSRQYAYRTIRELLVYDNKEMVAAELAGVAARQRENWDRMEEYLSQTLSNRFHASEFIFNEIMERTRSFVPFCLR